MVATHLPALRRLEHVVRLADSSDGFLQALDAACGETTDTHRRARQAEAARHSWNGRFETIEQLMRDVLTCAF